MANCIITFKTNALVDRLQKHCVRCGLFTYIYGQTYNLHSPICVGCACHHAEFLGFPEDNVWVVAAECSAFSLYSQ